MPAVNFFDAFTYKWAQAGTAFNWDDAQYKLGWSTVGSVPPSVEQFNRVHQVADEKANWLFDLIQTAATAKGITLAAADLQGLLKILNETAPAASESKAGIARIATTAQAQAQTDNTTVITPKKLSDSFSGGNQLKAQTGFQRLPGGLILQWGNSITAANGTVDVVFPTAFSSELYRSIINPIGDNFTVGRQNSAGVTGFNVNIVVASTGALTTAGKTVGWYAIGV